MRASAASAAIRVRPRLMRACATLLVALMSLSAPAAAGDAEPAALLATTPGALSESCQTARASLEPLMAALEDNIPPALLAEARQHLGSEASIATVWSDFAAAVLLMGDTELAAWVGLHAVNLSWDGELVGNAGTYLLHAGREEARTWLLCARDLGPPSPFVLEALAAAQEAAGDAAGAREAIAQARRLDPEDPMIEIEHSFLTTGAPPPPVPPANDAGERCLADLQRHAERVYAQVEAQQDRLDRLTGLDSREQAFAGAWETIYLPLLTATRAMLDQPAAVPAALYHNMVLAQCITHYIAFTALLLDSVVRDSGTTLTFWAEAMRLDPPVFVRDIVNQDVPLAEAMVFSVNRLPSTAVDKALSDKDKAASEQYWRDIDVCNGIDDMDASNACRREALRAECAANVANFEEWAAKQGRNVETAGQNFDRVALDLARWVEAEVNAAADFAERYAQELRNDGPEMPGPDGQPASPAEFALWQINLVYRSHLVESYLTTGPHGVDDFIAEQAQWFDMQKQWLEGGVESGRESLSSRCDAILNAEALQALAQAAWEAYRQELWDRMMANVEAEWDPRINCEGKIDGYTVSFDDRGFDTLSAKWKSFGASVDKTGKLKLSGSWKWKNVSFSARTTLRDGQVVSTSVGASGSTRVAPGVSAKGGVSVVSDGSRSEPAIVFSGSLELGFERGGAGISCSPGSGSFKIYPRAFTKAAVAYALAGGPP